MAKPRENSRTLASSASFRRRRFPNVGLTIFAGVAAFRAGHFAIVFRHLLQEGLQRLSTALAFQLNLFFAHILIHRGPGPVPRLSSPSYSRWCPREQMNTDRPFHNLNYAFEI